MKGLSGVVSDGVSDASKWLQKFSSIYEEWLGVNIYPGSLNLDIDYAFDWYSSELLDYRRQFSLLPHGGERDIFMIPCRIVEPGIQTCWLWTTTRGAE